MSWLGLREAGGGVFSPGGLERRTRPVVDLGSVLPRGSLMLELSLVPAQGTQVLLDFAATAPWPARMRVSVDGAGLLTLSHQSGQRAVRQTLDLGQFARTDEVTIIYTWDTALRQAVLSVDTGGEDGPVFRAVAAPLPLSLRDAARLMTDQRAARLAPEVRFAALADHVMPLGPLPTLGAETRLATPDGQRAISTLRPGDLVSLAEGGKSQVRWVGWADLPARGHHETLRVMAPFYGAARDLICARGQRLTLDGADVEYLFAAPRVACHVGHLSVGTALMQAVPRRVMRYWQLALDRPGAVLAGGLAIEPLDVARIRETPGLLSRSVLAGVPGELLPRAARSGTPVLGAVETRALCSLRAA